MNTDHIPENYHAVTPCLIVEDSRGVMAFMTQVFDAEEVMCHAHEDGSVMHAQMRIADAPEAASWTYTATTLTHWVAGQAPVAGRVRLPCQGRQHREASNAARPDGLCPKGPHAALRRLAMESTMPCAARLACKPLGRQRGCVGP